MRFILINITLLMALSLFAQKENKFIRSGNDLYAEENYKDAEVDYMKALEENPGSNKGQFNLGDALYKQESYEDAAKIFNNQTELLSDKNQRSDAYYNLGNSLLKANKFPESIDAYKKALRNNPKNMEAKYNMEYAKKKLEQQQNKDDQNKDNKDQDKKDQDKKDQDKKEQDKKDQEKQDQEKQQQDQQQDKKNQQGENQDQNKQEQSQPQQISKKDAQRMLEALKNNEKKTLEKLKLQKMKAGNTKKVEKDW